jgi:hypothetical protein
MAKNLLVQRVRKVNYLGAAGLLLLLSATAAFGVYPMWNKGKQYIRETETLNSKQTELAMLTASLQDAEAKFNETQARLTAREEELPSWDKEPNFYGNELTKIKKADNITLAATDLTKDLKPWNGYRVGSIDVRGNGDWKSVMKFLSDVREMKGLTRLDSLVLDAARDGGAQGFEQPRCEFRLSFSIFFKGG